VPDLSTNPDLPPLTPDEQSHSAVLVDHIRSEIETAGPLPFSRFMEMALYTPGLGYYANERTKFGTRGDFVTAPELGGLFAACLARQCIEILGRSGGMVLEAGGGRGTLAACLLLEFERLGALPDTYSILELSLALQEEQRRTLEMLVPHLVDRVRWITTLPEPGFCGVVVANELLDAMPVERFLVEDHRGVRLGVGLTDSGFSLRPIDDLAAVSDRVSSLGLPPGYRSEIGLTAEAWIRSVGDIMASGALLLIDYGFPRHEFYHPDRSTGTLVCHFRHRVHANPFLNVGLQDITAHVDFSAMAAAGNSAGLDTIGFTSQAMFLVDCGLEEIATEHFGNDTRANLRLANEIKTLTMPHEMGELFKVLALGRDVGPMIGFRRQDWRGRLNPG